MKEYRMESLQVKQYYSPRYGCGKCLGKGILSKSHTNKKTRVDSYSKNNFIKNFLHVFTYLLQYVNELIHRQIMILWYNNFM